MSQPPIIVLTTQTTVTDWQNIIYRSPQTSQNFGPKRQKQPLRQWRIQDISAGCSEIPPPLGRLPVTDTLSPPAALRSPHLVLCAHVSFVISCRVDTPGLVSPCSASKRLGFPSLPVSGSRGFPGLPHPWATPDTPAASRVPSAGDRIRTIGWTSPGLVTQATERY